MDVYHNAIRCLASNRTYAFEKKINSFYVMRLLRCTLTHLHMNKWVTNTKNQTQKSLAQSDWGHESGCVMGNYNNKQNIRQF